MRAAWVLGGAAALAAGCSSADVYRRSTVEVRTDGGGADAAPPADVAPIAPGSGPGSAGGVTNGVALTFHGDGPPDLATALLAEAERAGARVTVLAVGRWLGQNPQMARRVLDGGHEIGNHTENHVDIDALSPAAAYAEIAACAARLERLTGSHGRWFRPSRAQHATAAVRTAAASAGYPTVLSYDLDSLDYTDPGAATVEFNVLSAVRPGDVVSMHLGHSGTVEALPAILDGLRERGLRAVTASELFPQAVSAPEVTHR
jgi:peptidoglycan/xylan/chitin deacetylase (PgdA/CDA1 family)